MSFGTFCTSYEEIIVYYSIFCIFRECEFMEVGNVLRAGMKLSGITIN